MTATPNSQVTATVAHPETVTRRTWDGTYELEPQERRERVPDEVAAEIARDARGGTWNCGRCELEQWPRTARLYTPLHREAGVCPHCAEVLLARQRAQE